MQLLSKDIMKMKAKPFLKTTAIAFLLGGALCGSAAAGDVTGIWNLNCAACHGKDGKGQTMMGRRLGIKDLTDAKVQASFTDDQAAKAIKEGVKQGDKTVMAAVEGLSDDDIKALVAKVRAFKK